MKVNAAHAIIAGSLISVLSLPAFAAVKTSDEENIVVGACMIQKFSQLNPPVKQETIDKCASAEASDAPKCLSISNDTYISTIKFCISQLVNAKCVSDKMKKPLIQYADCGYEKDPAACYKELGFTTEQIVKLSADCEKEGAK